MYRMSIQENTIIYSCQTSTLDSCPVILRLLVKTSLNLDKFYIIMSDATTKKLMEEIARLEADLKTLEPSCTTSEAAKKVAEYCQNTPDPFLGENNSEPNPWHHSGQSSGSCSIL
ncbi:unnamed protein product [Peronospora belbahrii]|uniref:G protein gamma domain-containing protein n=1 Tax=Peronospora belbahrii TaxID=622444 RepID=A0AAU9KSD8_9STRA|nr:unnamed protein product [Peronospora belbahrii]CAH0516275.1 unnamed protein product [Peronospora belbahrii]